VGLRYVVRDLEDLKGVMELIGDMKKQGVTGATVARSFGWWMIQVHHVYEYWGSQIPHARSIARSPRRRWRLGSPRCTLGE
jgi:hypothetical protein